MASLTLFVPVLLLLIGGAAVIGMRQLNVRIPLIWSAAAVIQIGVWLTISSYVGRLPLTATWNSWFLFSGAEPFPWWSIDSTSWPVAFALVTLVLVVVLASLIELDRVEYQFLAALFFVCGAALMPVFSSAISSLLISLVFLDLVILVIRIQSAAVRSDYREAVQSFGANLSGILLLLLAFAYLDSGSHSGVPLPEQVKPLYYLAAIFRLVVVPLQSQNSSDAKRQNRLKLIVDFAQAAGSVMLLARAATGGYEGPWRGIFLFTAAIVGLYGGLRWLGSRSAVQAQPFWVISFSALALSSSIQGFHDAVIMFAVGMLLGGSALFFRSFSGRQLRGLIFLGLILVSGLPFTPLWPAARLFEFAFLKWGWIAALTMALILVGYLRSGLMVRRQIEQATPGVNAVYMSSLSLSLVGLAYLGWSYLIDVPIENEGWWGGGAVLLLSSGWFYLAQRVNVSPLPEGLGIRLDLPLHWAIHFLRGALRGTGRILENLARLFEGEAAILWAMVLIGLMITIFSQMGLGN